MKYTELECPTCGTKAVNAERTPDGKIGCFKGHWWKHEDSANYHHQFSLGLIEADKKLIGKIIPNFPGDCMDDHRTDIPIETFNFATDIKKMFDDEDGIGDDYWKERCLLAEKVIANIPFQHRDDYEEKAILYVEALNNWRSIQ